MIWPSWSFIQTLARSLAEEFSSFSCEPRLLFPLKYQFRKLGKISHTCLEIQKNQSCVTSSRPAINIPEPGNPEQYFWLWVDSQHAMCRECAISWKQWLMNLRCVAAMCLYNMPDSWGSIRYIFVHVWLPGTSHTWKIWCALKTGFMAQASCDACVWYVWCFQASQTCCTWVTVYNHLSF